MKLKHYKTKYIEHYVDSKGRFQGMYLYFNKYCYYKNGLVDGEKIIITI